MVSFVPLLITGKTVLHSIMPPVEALKIPASVRGPLDTPVPKVAEYEIVPLAVVAVIELEVTTRVPVAPAKAA
jgi:hypothetical protein